MSPGLTVKTLVWLYNLTEALVSNLCPIGSYCSLRIVLELLSSRQELWQCRGYRNEPDHILTAQWRGVLVPTWLTASQGSRVPGLNFSLRDYFQTYILFLCPLFSAAGVLCAQGVPQPWFSLEPQ